MVDAKRRKSRAKGTTKAKPKVSGQMTLHDLFSRTNSKSSLQSEPKLQQREDDVIHILDSDDVDAPDTSTDHSSPAEEGSICNDVPPSAECSQGSVSHNESIQPSNTQSETPKTNIRNHIYVESDVHLRAIDASNHDSHEDDVSNIPLDELALTASSFAIYNGSRCAPIVIDSSPSRSPIEIRPPSQLHPFFVPRKPPKPVNTSPRRSSNNTDWFIPFPDKDSQHVRGPQEMFEKLHLPSSLQRRLKPSKVHTDSQPLDYGTTRSLRHTPHSPHVSAPESPSGEPPPVYPALSKQDRDSFIDAIPQLHRLHPAIARISIHARSNSSPTGLETSQESWTEKWRPRRAEEVLANDDCALYLRDWLLALALDFRSTAVVADPIEIPIPKKSARKRAAKPGREKSSKRRRITREVDKTRRPRHRLDSDDEDSWVAADTESEDEPWQTSENDDEDLPFYRKTNARMHRSSPDPIDILAVSPPFRETIDQENKDSALPTAPPRNFENKLCNTILLAGPSGSGKTAAAFACADELGWEVFEVYPGIGERSGAELNKLIGGVGKNHIVRKTRRQESSTPEDDPRPSRPANINMLTFDRGPSGPSTSRRLHRKNTDDAQDNIDGSAHVPSSNGKSSTPGSTAVRQSIILIEEVDILYKTDANFWPSLINIIKESKRPVVLTCNDIALVPLRDLPLQTVLNFKPCPPSLATSYMSMLSLVERCTMAQPCAGQNCEQADGVTQQVDAAGDGIHDASTDLRRAINNLQFWNADPNESCLMAASSQRLIPNLPRAEAADNACRDYPVAATPDNTQELTLLRRLDKHHASMSFIESTLRRRRADIVQDMRTDDSAPSSDDPLGYTKLADRCSVSEVFLALYEIDEQLAADAVARARAELKAWYPGEALQEYPAEECTSACEMSLLGHRLVRLPLHVRVGGAALALEYGPYIRRMVAVDDEQELAHQPQTDAAPGGRPTRNSQKAAGYQRRFVLDDEQRSVLGRIAFAT